MKWEVWLVPLLVIIQYVFGVAFGILIVIAVTVFAGVFFPT